MSLNSFGQGIINNHWQLGQVDLNFTNITPTANTVSNGNNGGLAYISDNLGNLLFYTNGEKVWNKNHTIMNNGNSIISANNTINNSIIIPNVANQNQYYIITTYNLSCLCTYLLPTFYTYSLVDFSSNPLGSVVDLGNTNLTYGATTYSMNLTNLNSNDIVQNNYYYGPVTITKNSSNNSYWLIIQFQNKMLSYKIDGSGLNLIPVESNFPANQIYNPGDWDSPSQVVQGRQGAKIRISPSNNFLIGLEYPRTNVTNVIYSFSSFYKIDFNSTTGVFSNFQSLSNAGAKVFTFDISNNSQNLFFIRNKMTQVGQNLEGQVMVKDLLNNSTPVNSLNLTGTSTISSNFSSIQKDRNGNILLSSNFSNDNKYIHRIDTQDSFSTSSVFKNYVFLNNLTLGGSFPQLIPQLNPIIQNCQSLTLNTEPNTGVFTYQNYSDITTQVNYNVNLSTQDITMKARDFVVLKPNTHIVSGSKFLAKIETCSSGRFANELKNNSNNLENNIIETNISKVKIYPNPSNSFVKFESNEYTITRIIITSTDGFQVFNNRIDNISSYQLDVSFLRKGIYIVTFETKEGSNFVEKLIKN